MTLESFVVSIESEWEPEKGFFWSIRQGTFREDEFRRALAKFAAVPAASGGQVPARLVSVLWYAPLFMQWQRERVQEQSADMAAYTKAMNKLTAEVERILGVP